MASKSFSSPSATANQRTHAKTGGYGYANKKTQAHEAQQALSRRPLIHELWATQAKNAAECDSFYDVLMAKLSTK